jgi:hypothetical protein
VSHAAADRAAALVLLGGLTGCGLVSDEPESGSLSSSTVAEAPPVERWERNAQRREQVYLDQAARIAPALGSGDLLPVGVELCRRLFQTLPDDDLVEFVRQAALDGGVKVTSAQAVQFVVLTNDQICPDLAR